LRIESSMVGDAALPAEATAEPEVAVARTAKVRAVNAGWEAEAERDGSEKY
jgi:hypothetical protein